MTLFPIVERELRVAARKKSTYYYRLVAAFIAVVVGTIIVETMPLDEGGARLFRILSWLAIIYALLAGTQATADSISSEKREGTLGLLFLTDLRGADIVLGKLAATSMDTFYGLLGLLPVLALPLLMGGVGGGEFWRMVLVILALLLLSVSCGLFASSISFVPRKAIEGAFLLLFLLSFGIWFGCAASLNALDYQKAAEEVFRFAPLAAWDAALDNQYRLAPDHYWQPVALCITISLCLLTTASFLAARIWSERIRLKQTDSWRTRWENWTRGPRGLQMSIREKLLNVNPILWLASRFRHLRWYPWIFLGATLVFWGWGVSRSVGGQLETTVMTFASTHAILKYWFAAVNLYGLANDRDKDALELIFSTPLTESEIIKGQWLAFRRLFGQPFLALAIIEPLLIGWSLQFGYNSNADRAFLLFTGFFGLILLAADCFAIGCLGMWLAVKARTPQRGATQTALIVLIIPWLILGFLAALDQFWRTDIKAVTWSIIWVFLSLLTDILCWLWSHVRLTSDLRRTISERYTTARPITVGTS
jgi:ABC-type transport system involved in cytochrome c biogenesis permease component